MRFFTAALFALSLVSAGVASSSAWACECGKDAGGKACACESAKSKKKKKCNCGESGDHAHEQDGAAPQAQDKKN
jgi:hypothetical protein